MNNMSWFESARQAVLAWVSNFDLNSPIFNPQARAQTSRMWNSHGRVNVKSLAQVSLLATFSDGLQPRGTSASCPNAQLSCHNTTAVDTCCLNYPGGLMLQTQFWDTQPPVGPSDSWTVHGLWFVLAPLHMLLAI